MTLSPSEVPPRIRAIQRHLRGVRRRVCFVSLSFGLGASLTWYYKTPIFLWLYAPARQHLGNTWRPIFTSPTEMFWLSIKLALLGGVTVALPVLLYHILRFCWPILGRHPRRFLTACFPVALLCYLGGASFAYFVLLPVGMGFLLNFGTDIAIPMIRVTEYMSIVMMMIFWLGVVFELPLAMIILTKFRIVQWRTFWHWNKYLPFTASILAVILTPTSDIVNFALVAVPIILLYEVGLACAWLAKPRIGA